MKKRAEDEPPSSKKPAPHLYAEKEGERAAAGGGPRFFLGFSSHRAREAVKELFVFLSWGDHAAFFKSRYRRDTNHAGFVVPTGRLLRTDPELGEE